MKKRRPLEKEEARMRRDGLMERAGQAQLSLTDGVREMRAISGLTQDQFAEHRGISTRAMKELERGRGNPTIATLNRIAEFYGLEVAFVPSQNLRTKDGTNVVSDNQGEAAKINHSFIRMQNEIAENQRRIEEMIRKMNFDESLSKIVNRLQSWEKWAETPDSLVLKQQESSPATSLPKSKKK